MAFLNNAGLERLWAHIISKLNTKVDKDKLGGTVEVTSGLPQKEQTVLTVDPEAEAINLYTAEEVDAMMGSYTLPVATKETLGGVIVGDGLQVDADGKVGLKPEQPMRLINSVTLQEPVASVLIDKNTNGEAFAVKSIFVQIVAPQKIDKNVMLTNSVRAIALIAANKLAGQGYVAGMLFEIKNNRLFMLDANVAPDVFQSVDTSAITPYGSGAGFIDYADISAIGVNVLSGGELPAGTEVSIYEMGVF